MQSPLQGAVKDTGKTPKKMAGGGKKGEEGRDDDGDGDDKEQRDYVV